MEELKIFEIKAIKRNDDGSVWVGTRNDETKEGTYVHLTIGPRSSWAVDPVTKKLERVASRGRNLVRTIWNRDTLYKDVVEGVVKEGTRVSGTSVTLDTMPYEVGTGEDKRTAESATRFVFEGETLKQAFSGFQLIGDETQAGFTSIATDIADGEPATAKAPAEAEAIDVA